MKIFNWVHRKLNGQPSSVPLHTPKGEAKMSQLNVHVKSGDEDTESLLGWRDGLLAIGTLGLPIDHHRPHAGYIMIPSFEVFDYPEDIFTNVGYFNEAKFMEEVIPIGEEDDAMPLVCNVYSSHEIEEVDNKKNILSIKTEDVTDVKGSSNETGGRTTLADLFKAEAVASQKCIGKSDSVVKENDKKGDEEIGKHKKYPYSLSGKLVKKLIPSHDVQPIKKINYMMKKMMKKKIHPELLCQKSASGIILENKHEVMMTKVQGFKGMALLPPEEPLVMDN